jgi:hypothetical protein
MWARSNNMNNQAPGITLPSWVKPAASPLAQIGSQLTDEEVFRCPSLPPEEQQKVDQAFGSLSDAFAKFEYSTSWRWPDLDPPKTSAEEAIARGWAPSYKSARRLLRALRDQGYRHTTVTIETCLLLEEMKQKRLRQQAQQRQARRRARLLPEARAEIREKDRRYRRRKRSTAKKESTKREQVLRDRHGVILTQFG